MDRVRIGIAGCGLFGESHLQAFRAIPAAEVIAVYDTDGERARALASGYNVPRVCSSLEDLCRSQADAIDVVVEEGAHRIPVLAAIASSKHVFVEKPFATNLADCSEMIRAAERGQCVLMVGHILRFETKYALLKQEAESGRLGKIVSMHARRNRLKAQLGRYGRTHPMMINAIHDIDLMLWYTQDRVIRVRGYGRKVTGGKHDDICWGVLEFEQGALGFVETVWLLPKQSGIMLDDAFQLIGDRGVANLNLFPGELSFWREEGFDLPDTSYSPLLGSAARGALRDELAYFCDCVKCNKSPEAIKPADAKNAVRVALALIESAAAGCDVAIAEWN